MRWSFPWLLVVLPACQRAEPSLPKHWELEITFSAGMCEVTATESCNESWKLTEAGPIVHVEHLAGGPKQTSPTLAAAQRDGSESLLRTADFQQGMTGGFPCAKDTVHDLWVNLRFIDRDRGTDRTKNVTACGLGGDKDNVVSRLTSAVFAAAK